MKKGDLLFLLTIISLVYAIIGSVLIFHYGYKPLRFLKSDEGLVDTVLINAPSSAKYSRISGFKLLVKDRPTSISYNINIFNKEKQKEVFHSIPVNSRVKVWHFNAPHSTNNIIYAEFDNGYNICLHSKTAGALVYYSFWINILLFFYLVYKGRNYKEKIG